MIIIFYIWPIWGHKNVEFFAGFLGYGKPWKIAFEINWPFGLNFWGLRYRLFFHFGINRKLSEYLNPNYFISSKLKFTKTKHLFPIYQLPASLISLPVYIIWWKVPASHRSGMLYTVHQIIKLRPTHTKAGVLVIQ